jgi:hypothetical protein
MFAHIIFISVGILSVIVSQLLPSANAGSSGITYFLIGPAFSVFIQCFLLLRPRNLLLVFIAFEFGYTSKTTPEIEKKSLLLFLFFGLLQFVINFIWLHNQRKFNKTNIFRVILTVPAIYLIVVLLMRFL